MTVLTLGQAAQDAYVQGFRGNGLQIILAIAQAESKLDTAATNSVGNSAGTDRGILQINSYYHSEVTDACAFDPNCAFSAGYKISKQGTDFTPWSTYTSGAYKQYMQGTNAVNPSQPSTVKPWYTFPRIDNLGGVEPFGGFPKPDSNIQIPANYPVTALLPGTVTALDGGEVAWGAVVTIKLDTPLNSLATHTAYLHLARSTVSVGQHVNVNDLIGYNGYSAAAGAQKVPLGFALYNGDHYGFGAAWSLMTKANLQGPLSPVSLLDNAAANGPPSVVVTSPTQSSGVTQSLSLFGGTNFTYTGLSQQVHNTLNTVPGFYGICVALDEAEQFPGIVNVATSNFDIPGIVRSVLLTAMDNVLPLVVRGGIAFLGLFMLIALVGNVTRVPLETIGRITAGVATL